VSLLESLFEDAGLTCHVPSKAIATHTLHSHWLQPGETEATLVDEAAVDEADGVWASLGRLCAGGGPMTSLVLQRM
jgi:hypothetical protein